MYLAKVAIWVLMVEKMMQFMYWQETVFCKGEKL